MAKVSLFGSVSRRWFHDCVTSLCISDLAPSPEHTPIAQKTRHGTKANRRALRPRGDPAGDGGDGRGGVRGSGAGRGGVRGNVPKPKI